MRAASRSLWVLVVSTLVRVGAQQAPCVVDGTCEASCNWFTESPSPNPNNCICVIPGTELPNGQTHCVDDYNAIYGLLGSIAWLLICYPCWRYRCKPAAAAVTVDPDDDENTALLPVANCSDQSPPLPWRKFCSTCGQQQNPDCPVAFCPGCGAASSGVDGDGDPIPLPSRAMAQFDARFGAHAVSHKRATPPATGMIQVNLANDNTRTVQALSVGGQCVASPVTTAPPQPSCPPIVPSSGPNISYLPLGHVTQPGPTVPTASAAFDPIAARGTVWQSTGMGSQKLFPVAAGTAEHTAVHVRFAATMPHYNIDRVDRVENGYQHEQFTLAAGNIARQAGTGYISGAMRQLLWHGTTAVDQIVNGSLAGFLPLLSGTATGALYGDGSYFARDAKYSNNYACRLSSGQRQLLLVDVAVGRWTLGVKGMNVYPLLPGEEFKRYDSLVNNVQDPHIFVVQHSNQAYPAYLVTYH